MVTLNSKAIQSARRVGKDLYNEAKSANIILLGPEQLLSKRFDIEFLRDPDFRNRLVLVAIDEAHFINLWGVGFRQAYAQLGFLQARIPRGVPFVCGSATITPRCLEGIQKTLGLSPQNSILTRRSNERQNLRFVFRILGHGLGGETFPCLQWVLPSAKKTVIFCRTIDLCDRVVRFLRAQVNGKAKKFKAVRMYTALMWEEDNKETKELFEKDAECYVVVATVCFGVGVNLRNTRTVVNLGDPEDASDLVQKGGRAGRDGQPATVVTYVEKAIWKRAQLQAMDAEGAAEMKEGRRKTRGQGASKVLTEASVEKAKIYNQTTCAIATMNRIFDVVDPKGISDCIDAKRPSPCSHCIPEDPSIFNAKIRRSRKPKVNVNIAIPSDHTQLATDRIYALREQIYLSDGSPFIPISSIIPTSVITHCLANFRALLSAEAIINDPGLSHWSGRASIAERLAECLQKLATEIEVHEAEGEGDAVITAASGAAPGSHVAPDLDMQSSEDTALGEQVYFCLFFYAP